MKSDEELIAAISAVSQACYERGITFVGAMRLKEKKATFFNGNYDLGIALCQSLCNVITKLESDEGTKP